MTKKKIGDSLQHNNFQFLDNKWYLYTTPHDKLTPTKSCDASGTNLKDCIQNFCYTNNGYPFKCLPAKNKGQSAMLVPKAGLDGVLCDPNEKKTSNIPYVINVVQKGDTTDYVCSNQSTTSGTYRCDPKYGCIEDSKGTLTAKDCLENCKSGYKCNDDYTCSSCLISESDPECLYGNCSTKREFCMDCGKDNNCSGNGKCVLGNACKCNNGYFGVHCEKKTCLTVPSGTCKIGGKDTCNKSVPGCEYSPYITQSSRRNPVSKCICVPDYSKEALTTNVASVDCPNKLPPNHPLKNPHAGIGKKYWDENKEHGGFPHIDWNAICRQNYGNRAYSNGFVEDCGRHDRSQWYLSSVKCVAPAGSIHNVPWAFYQSGSF